MEFRPFRVELATSFRGVTSRSGVLIRGTGPDGADAWGEYSPFDDYSPERASRWWRAAMEAARGEFPAPIRDAVEVNSIVPEVPPAQAARLAVAGGCRTAKVKVAGYCSTMQDAARVEAVAGALGPGGKVRVDANGHWDVDDAVRALTELELAARRGGLDGLEYVEQPCATIDELAKLRRRVDTKIAADESIRIPTDPMAVVRKHAADIIVLKVAPLGGVQACLDLAEQAGIPVVVASAMESSVGLAAGIALARALPELEYACGLGTGALLATDTVRETIVPKNGMLGPVNLDVIA
ncbi:o-succinylbenzoate synthase [Demequina aurantiaca]|uniref:o-succinylbenzoate synthase n=1 Tax=Demequina aurantiaca TaxID=676200 RepID=UPI00128E1484|nr:o-succinylbenzoate synthase [Demequina aurantiaca]